MRVTDIVSPECATTIGVLEAGKEVSYQCTVENIQESFINVATAIGETEDGETVEDIDSVDINLKQGTLIVIKKVVNDDGGKAKPNSFTIEVEGGAVEPPSFLGSAEGVEVKINVGSDYNVSESGPSGYTGTFSSGCRGVMPGGDPVTCTIVNDDQPAKLRIIKKVINNNGGTASPSDFIMDVDGGNVSTPSFPGSQSGVTVTLNAGSFKVTETQLEGYSASKSGLCSGTLRVGQSATCTYINDDITAKVTLTKQVINDNGGNASPNDFKISVGGTVVNSGTTISVDANTPIAIDENELRGYDFINILGDEDCPTELGGTVTLALGQTLNCTIVNDDVAPQVTLNINVNNNNGGNAGPNDFGTTLGGNSINDGDTVDIDSNTPTPLNQLGLPGYEFVNITGDPRCPDVLGGKITLNEGVTISCTINLDDIAPTITLIKSVTNDNGGNAEPDDFGLTVGGNSVTSGASNAVTANTTISINEDGLDGYDFVSITGDAKCPESLGGTLSLDEGESITCTITNNDITPQVTVNINVTNNNGGNAGPNDFGTTVGGTGVNDGGTVDIDANNPTPLDQVGLPGYDFVNIIGDPLCPAVLAGTITLDEGVTISCTINLDDVAPTITLIKNVINDNGGIGEADDFGISIDGVGVTSGSTHTKDANTTVTINEAGLDGYDFLSITGDAKCPESLGGSFTLDEGENLTCTINNDDALATITITSNVINDDGGNAGPNDFGITFDGNVVTSGNVVTVNANTPLALTQTGLSGYNFISITGDPECPAVLGGTLTLVSGANISCTITNDDIAPTITLTKSVTNDNGGNAGADDFGISIGGIGVTSGAAITLNANTAYAINETGLDGYAFMALTGDSKCPSVLGGTVTLDEGESVSCTISNDDAASTITLIKIVINDNGGNAGENDFGISIGGTTVSSNSTTTVDSNTAYAIDEAGLSGYDFVSITGDGCPASLGGTVTLDEGQNVTCTITNNDDAPTITVNVDVSNDNGGNAGPNDFGTTLGGNSVSSGDTVTVDANTGNVLDQLGLDGYDFASITGDPQCPAVLNGTITLDEGVDISCTIHVDDVAPTVSLNR